MCGRYVLFGGPPSRYEAYFETLRWPAFPDRFNIAPSLEVPVIRQAPTGERVADLLKWGLVPHWAKDASIGQKLNNARAETVAEKPSFRSAYKARRCLVPASGFYEWQAVPNARKQPWYFHLKSSGPMAMGGLWESWTSPDGEILRSFCIVTTIANELMAPVHDRMPVIVDRANWAAWLDPSFRNVEALSQLLAPLDAAQMDAWPVSCRVSNAREEGPALIEKIAPDQSALPDKGGN